MEWVQRCADLMEVCQSQLQFAPMRPLPVFGGTRGVEIRKSIEDIHASFQQKVKALAACNYNILDVKVGILLPFTYVGML